MGNGKIIVALIIHFGMIPVINSYFVIAAPAGLGVLIIKEIKY